MSELFIPYTEALQLKKLGFDEPCLRFYQNSEDLSDSLDDLDIPYFTNKKAIENQTFSCLAPLYTQVFKWFRDKYNLILDILPFYDEKQLPLSLTNKQKPKGYFIWDYYNDEFNLENSINYSTYEQAELECLRKLIEIVKEQKK